MISGNYDQMTNSFSTTARSSKEMNDPKIRENFANASRMVATTFQGQQILAKKNHW
jgi:hypothetical protein